VNLLYFLSGVDSLVDAATKASFVVFLLRGCFGLGAGGGAGLGRPSISRSYSANGW
jgi:hypothetical protein